jgi:hypothetical protein
MLEDIGGDQEVQRPKEGWVGLQDVQHGLFVQEGVLVVQLLGQALRVDVPIAHAEASLRRLGREIGDGKALTEEPDRQSVDDRSHADCGPAVLTRG